MQMKTKTFYMTLFFCDKCGKMFTTEEECHACEMSHEPIVDKIPIVAVGDIVFSRKTGDYIVVSNIINRKTFIGHVINPETFDQYEDIETIDEEEISCVIDRNELFACIGRKIDAIKKALNNQCKLNADNHNTEVRYTTLDNEHACIIVEFTVPTKFNRKD